MPRDAESRKTFYLQSVLFCVRIKLIWLLRGEGKTVMINSAAARSRVRSPTRTYQSHTAVHHCGDQVAFQENGPTYVDPSSRRIQTVSGRYAATPRSKSIATFLAFDRPTKVTFHTPTLGRSTITVLATLSAASKTGGRASTEAIHTTTCDHSLCARKGSSTPFGRK